jgi:hypothetical protein
VQTVTVQDAPTRPFGGQILAAPGGVPERTHGPALGDFDGDGRDDLACTAPFGAAGWQVQAWRNEGRDAPWTALPVPALTGAFVRGATTFGDFDGDGHRDLADTWGRVFYGDGGTSWTPAAPLPLLIPAWGACTAADVDGDGRDDLVFAAGVSDAVQVLRSLPGRTFVDWSGTLPAATNGPSGSGQIAAVDFDGDGHRDLVATGSVGLRAWRGNGAGTWTSASVGLPTTYVGGFACADVDRDGVIDLVTNGDAGIVAAEWVPGGWQSRPPASVTLGVGAIVALDHDRDGWPDLASPAGVAQNLGGQGLAQPVPFTGPSPWLLSTGIATGDLDGDTWPDLVVTLEGLPPLLLYNTGSGLSPYGSSCAAPGFATPATVGIGQPMRGNPSFALALEGAAPAVLGLIWIGLDDRFAFGTPMLPYDLARHGAPGCRVFASSEAVHFVLADAAGRAQVPLPIPNLPALRRVVLFAQAAAAAPGANALGWLFGNGLAFRIP